MRVDGAEPALIMHKHKLLNQWLQFGGHVELNENIWTALIHEVAEESGYAMSQLKLLQPSLRLKQVGNAILHPSPVSVLTHQFSDTDHHHTDIAYTFVARESPAAAVGEGESADIRTFTAAELAAIPPGEVPENVRNIGLFCLQECLSHWEEVETSQFSIQYPETLG